MHWVHLELDFEGENQRYTLNLSSYAKRYSLEQNCLSALPRMVIILLRSFFTPSRIRCISLGLVWME